MLHRPDTWTDALFIYLLYHLNFLTAFMEWFRYFFSMAWQWKPRIALREERLSSTHNRPSCLPTGTQPSPRSASVWRSVSRSSSSSSISKPTHCTHWLLTGNTVLRHWVVTRGRRWLVLGRPYSPTATKKGSTLPVALRTTPKQESVSLETTRGIVHQLTPESALVLEGVVMTPTRVEIMDTTMEKQRLKPWDTSWFSRVELTRT